MGTKRSTGADGGRCRVASAGDTGRFLSVKNRPAGLLVRKCPPGNQYTGMPSRSEQRTDGKNSCHTRTESQSRDGNRRSEEHTSELQSRPHLVCRLLLE